MSLIININQTTILLIQTVIALQNIANNWKGYYKLSDTLSAYSTMIPDQDGNILFLMEENALQNHYDIVFNKLTLSEITNHTYQ